MGVVHQGVSRLNTFAGYSNLEVEVCASCGVLFAAPEAMLDAARKTGNSFYCPNGHSLTYKSENARLKRQLELARDDVASTRARLDQEESRSRALKGVVTKTKKKLSAVEQRASAGVCPCCNRTFQQLARHMKGQHPDFEPTAAL